MLDLLTDGPGRHIMDVSYGLLRQVKTFIDDMPMTSMETRVLLYVATEGGEVTQRNIEQQFGLTAATISELTRGMEAKGLVRREVDPADRRRKRIIMVDETNSRLDAIREYLCQIERSLIEVLHPLRLDEFNDALNRMAALYPANAKPAEGLDSGKAVV